MLKPLLKIIMVYTVMCKRESISVNNRLYPYKWLYPYRIVNAEAAKILRANSVLSFKLAENM